MVQLEKPHNNRRALKKVGFHLFQSLEAMSGAVAFF
jgi:hypothetical protein